MSCPGRQGHRTRCRQSPVRTLPLLPDAFACGWRPCSVTWDAVSEQVWLFKLQRKPAFKAFQNDYRLESLRQFSRASKIRYNVNRKA